MDIQCKPPYPFVENGPTEQTHLFQIQRTPVVNSEYRRKHHLHFAGRLSDLRIILQPCRLPGKFPVTYLQKTKIYDHISTSVHSLQTPILPSAGAAFEYSNDWLVTDSHRLSCSSAILLIHLSCKKINIGEMKKWLHNAFPVTSTIKLFFLCTNNILLSFRFSFAILMVLWRFCPQYLGYSLPCKL